MILSALVALSAAQAPLVPSPPRSPLPKPAATARVALVHDNDSPAGVRRGNLLTMSLEVVEASWKPEGDTDPRVPVLAFAESGKDPLVPGPLIRAPAGTEIRITIRNRADTALMLAGLRPGFVGLDTVHLPSGATRELRHRLETPGNYLYWGSFLGNGLEDRLWKDSQLNGAIVVDAPGDTRRDHVFLLSEWFYPYPDNRPFEVVSVINGRAWPHTQRITLRQNDSTRFRVFNAIPLHHPMHLHGFYYRIESRGLWNADRPIAREEQPLLNTDLLPPAGTMTLAFLPNTPGNWLFHCHLSFHMDETVTLAGSPRDSAEAAAAARHGSATHGGEHHMRGLVVGIQVTPAPGYTEPVVTDARAMRLLVQKSPNRLATGAPAYGFVLQSGDSVPKRDSVALPAPVLELTRGKPVRITVVNNLVEPTGIHWHGLEIESFPDGVANWSGMDDRVFPPVAPGDSFVAAFTPPRSGTYPYHSHLNERHQISSGMYGAILVTDGPRDPTRDHLIVAGGGGPVITEKLESPYALVNGRRFPRPLTLTAGETHRLRIVSIHPDWRVSFSLRSDSAVARWRAIAKDGADLPPVQATERPAYVEMGPGETADFEFHPTSPGTWRIEVKSVEPGWYIPLTVIVKPRG